MDGDSLVIDLNGRPTACWFIEDISKATIYVSRMFPFVSVSSAYISAFSPKNQFVFSFDLTNVSISPQLKCLANGSTKPQYRWMKDGRFVSNWHDLGDYTIGEITEDDQGGYSCLASSSAGLIQSSVAYMTVNGNKLEKNMPTLYLKKI